MSERPDVHETINKIIVLNDSTSSIVISTEYYELIEVSTALIASYNITHFAVIFAVNIQQVSDCITVCD